MTNNRTRSSLLRVAVGVATFALCSAFVRVSSAHAQVMRQIVRPFTVERANGDVYRNPFSGGLWQPRAGLRDIDVDGRLDLFTLNPDGELRLYRNDGDFRFVRVLPSPYDTLTINSWFRFADLDGDNDGELLTAGPRSEVIVYYNDGTDPAPRFRAVQYLTSARADSAQRLDTIRTQRETVPSLVDIDADGDVDLFAGNIDGTISFYENIGTPQVASLVFRTADFEDLQVIGAGSAKQQDASNDGLMSGRHGASVLDFTDLDGDGDLDILFGDFFTTKMLLFTNTGTRQAPAFSMTRLDTAFRPTGDDVESEGFNQPVTGDIDNDGDLDAIISSLNPVASVPPLTLYENIGSATSPAMRRRTIDLTSEIDVGIYAAPAAINDATRNGILVGSSAGRIHYFARDVELGETMYRLEESFALPGLFQTVPAAGDLDGDGISEIVVGESNGDIIFMRFNGAALERFGDLFQVNRNASPTLVDFDGDGDLDLFAGSEGGRVVYYENTGSRTFPNFVAAETPAPFAGLDVGHDASPRFFDLDRDGDLDVMLGGRTGGANTQRDTLQFFLRDGNDYVTSASFPALDVARSPTALGVVHDNGRYILVGDLSGGIKALSLDGSGHSGDNPTHSEISTRIEIERGVVHLDIERSGSEPATVRLVDVMGRELLRESVERARKARIMLGSLASGTYLVEIAIGDRRSARTFVVSK